MKKKKRFNAVQEQVVKKKVLRQVISLKKIPIEEIKYQNGSKITLPDNKTVYLTEDSAGIAKILQKFFQKEGILSSLIKIDDILGNHVDITDAAGLVIIADAPEQKNASSSRTFLKQSFLVAGKFAPILCGAAEAKGAFFSTISFMGGSFGFDENEIPEPVQGGLAGLSKTAALEWEGVACKSIDMPCTPEEIKPLAKAAVTLMISHGPVEAGLKPRHCIIPELIKKPLEPASNANAIIPGSNDVIVITGGAKGVTAQCAIAIAKAFAPTIILLGRSKAPDQEPKWMEGLTSDQEIKKAILKNHFNDKKPSPIELEKISKKFIGNREIKKKH